MEIEETVEGVLVNMVGGGTGDRVGVTTVGEVGTCNEVEEGIVGEGDGDGVETDMDTIAVDVREPNEDVVEIIGGDSVERLLSIVLSQLRSREVYAEAVGHKKNVSNKMSGPSGKAMDCTEGEARRIDDS
jgi:hypothetical protein